VGGVFLFVLFAVFAISLLSVFYFIKASNKGYSYFQKLAFRICDCYWIYWVMCYIDLELFNQNYLIKINVP